jgi:hypothetical protein
MISLLGCSGVGKSSVINELLKLRTDGYVYPENVGEILLPNSNIVYRNPYDKFLATQKAFLDRDIEALKGLDSTLLNIFDNRISEYVFYLLHYPEFSCDSEESAEKLKPQIEYVLNVRGLKVFYLADDIENIKLRVKNDPTRSRNSWSYFVEHMYPYHESWHASHGATIINIKGRESAEIAKYIFAAL